MSTIALQALIYEASTQLGSTACQAGRHLWAFDGGRACPHDIADNCSQAVYRCRVCGIHDYGESGGPGEKDCETHCEHKDRRAIAIKAARRDPFDLLWWQFAAKNKHRYHHMLLRALRRQPKPNLP